jgi:ligand-binding sensor domain-containing protein/signal transduction histidine kinase
LKFTFYILLIICCLLSPFGCGEKDRPKPESSETPVYPSGKSVNISNLLTVIISSCPKPAIIPVPSKPGGSYKVQTKDGIVSIPLLPPENKPASFFMHMQTYTTDQGLALDGIEASCIDHFGNLWFGTYGGGVSRYDGKSFTTFTTGQGLSNKNVWCMLEDKKGNMWFGTEGGVSRYDGKSFTTFTTADGLGNNIIRGIGKDKKGNIWFGTNGGGVSRYDGKSFTTYTTTNGLGSNSVWSIAEDRKGNMWFGTGGGGVSCYDGKSFTTYTVAQGLGYNSVSSILEDKDGNIWFGTYGGGVSCYDGKSFTTYTVSKGLADNKVWCMLEDKGGNMWFGTDGGGVSCYDGKSFTTLTTADGLSKNSVFSILEDRWGNLWFSTFGGGVSRYDGKSFTSCTTAQGLGNNIVLSVLQDKKGIMWFGTYGGVSRYDGKSFITYTPSQGLGSNSIMCMLEDKSGCLWFGNDGGGASRYDGKSFTTYTSVQGLGNDFIRCMLEDKGGNIWFGTAGAGVSRYDGKTFTTYTTANGLGNNYVRSILQDRRGNIWFGTSGGGVSLYDGKTFTTYTSTQGLGNNHVFSMLEDKEGNLWFGTFGAGVSRYDGKSFTTYTTAQGLPDDGITQLAITKEENIVVGTNYGMAILLKFKQKVAVNPSSSAEQSGNESGSLPVQNSMSNAELRNYLPIWKVYNSKTGYPVKDINSGQNSMYVDNKGIIWAGTGSGKTALVRFDPSTVNRNLNQPQVAIQSILVNDENICWYTVAPLSSSFGKEHGKERDSEGTLADSATMSQQEGITLGKTLTEAERDTLRSKFAGVQFDNITRYYPLPEHLVLPYKYNHITFQFAAIEPVKPYLVNYQYILEGYDKEWSPITSETSATFGNMDEGTYTFILKAQSPERVWSEPITYSFKVLPPWWRTVWFNSIVVLIILTSFGYIVKYALTRKLRKRMMDLERQNALAEERSRILKDMHDDIGSGLSKIAMMSEMAGETNGKELNTQVEKIGKSARELVDNMGQIVWALNPRNDSLANLLAYFNHYAYDYFEYSGIKVKIEFPAMDEKTETSLSHNVRRNLFLSYKEALHNIVKHSGATEVYVNIELKDILLMINIKDNGNGITKENKFGNGLLNMESRMRDIGGKFEIAANKPSGTKVNLSLALT